MKKNIYLNGIMGVVIGDALGCPVEFVNREELEASPVTDMGEYGTFNMPKGTWTDDSSMTMATLDALRYGYDIKRIEDNFVKWLFEGKYTPAGNTFDVGATCEMAITRYKEAQLSDTIHLYGLQDEYSNGNGSLMRIMPMCLFSYELLQSGIITEEGAISMIHDVSAITHAHLRSQIACGLYFFIVNEILSNRRSLVECIDAGLQRGFSYYRVHYDEKELSHYSRLFDLEKFRRLSISDIRSTGYVVDSLEASIWSLVNTSNFKSAVLKAVNLGGDADTIAAITGGLAGLYYGLEEFPREWMYVIQRKEWIEKKCEEVARSDKGILFGARKE